MRGIRTEENAKDDGRDYFLCAHFQEGNVTLTPSSLREGECDTYTLLSIGLYLISRQRRSPPLPLKSLSPHHEGVSPTLALPGRPAPQCGQRPSVVFRYQSADLQGDVEEHFLYADGGGSLHVQRLRLGRTRHVLLLCLCSGDAIYLFGVCHFRIPESLTEHKDSYFFL